MEMPCNSELFNQVEQKLQEGTSDRESQQLITFARKVFELVPEDEMKQELLDDIAAFIRSLWSFFQQVEPGEPKIKVFNPELEKDGWNYPHTLIFILQRDMPFLVDTITIELNRQGLGIQAVNSTVLYVSRDDTGTLEAAMTEDATHREALIFFQVDCFSGDEARQQLFAELASVLADVEVVTDDYRPILDTMDGIIEEARENTPGFANDEQKEFVAFLEWLRGGHFTFLGYTRFDLENTDEEQMLSNVADGKLGLFRPHRKETPKVAISSLNPGMNTFYHENADMPVAFSKSSWRARVHRQAYSDYVVVKRFNEKGEPIGEHRFLGLYTSAVYHLSPFKIPIIRKRVSKVFTLSGLEPGSHDGKALRQIIEVHPREELFHCSEEQLYRILIGIWQIQERRQVRLFVRTDPFEKFISCIVYMPRDIYRPRVHTKVQDYLCQQLDASESEFNTYFAESILVRTHWVLRINSDKYKSVDHREMESHIATLTRDWRDDFLVSAIEQWGEGRGRSKGRDFRNAFPAGYREDFDCRSAVHDIELFEVLEDEKQIAMNFYQPLAADANIMKFKIFRLNQRLELSDLVPILENLGFRVQGEHPYEITPYKGPVVWLHEFTLKFGLDIAVDVVAVRNQFQDAFAAIWSGVAENDEFNRLVVGARLEWRTVAMLRMYAEYMKQLGQSFSRSFIAQTLATNLDIARNLVALFKSYFDPKYVEQHGDQIDEHHQRSERLRQKILDSLEHVANLNEDQVLRSYLQLMNATLRTNFYQCGEDGNNKPYISIKLAPGEIPGAPEPRPKFEVFVHSPRVEGVHLRAGKVARGGIRWSDRLEDYRTEVLGLVKAQQVKNAVIVPTGAKGGFVAKQTDRAGTREAFLEEGVSCYKLFMQGLLDITDNLADGETVAPKQVVRRDDEDTYLVVAADKGTATFSDIANGISEDYGHWLGDAYASGGSNGYDHKKMGITARGAWVAVQRHFREQGLNTQEDAFTVVGIGDMGGDVFGNGMLMSNHIKMVAAFNHLHIFIDPGPDLAKGFAERERLFNLPRSSWEDYNPELISAGGGVFPRAAKSIEVTPQMRELFDIPEQQLTPPQLINYLLKSRVDLIWNGGIGTYVKAASESHMDVGDRTNDSLRVNGAELRCKVFGEGGNLGLTQLGRIEYCLNGGACNTDFIDNAAGVDCSDHEVNIKIVLNQLLANGSLTYEQRNQFLEQMTDSVAEGVLHNNYRQTQAIFIAQNNCAEKFAEYARCINEWECSGSLNRALEYLPDDEALGEREKTGQYLVRPELSVLVSYSKILLKDALSQTDIDADDYIAQAVYDAFPPEIVEQYGTEIANHNLRKEITVNQVANEIVNLMGLSFTLRQITSTGADVGDVVRAYLIIRDILKLKDAWQEVEALDYKQPSGVQFELFECLMRVGRRATRWILRNRRACQDISAEVTVLQPIIQSTIDSFPETLEGDKRDEFDKALARLQGMGLSQQAAMLICSSDSLYFGFGVADLQLQTGLPPELVNQVYFKLGKVLELEWFSEQIILLPHTTRWDDFARESFMDDLEGQRRLLTQQFLGKISNADEVDPAVAQWQQQQEQLINRWGQMVQDLKAIPTKDFAMFSVALRELLDLVQATMHHGEEPVCAEE